MKLDQRDLIIEGIKSRIARRKEEIADLNAQLQEFHLSRPPSATGKRRGRPPGTGKKKNVATTRKSKEAVVNDGEAVEKG